MQYVTTVSLRSADNGWLIVTGYCPIGPLTYLFQPQDWCEPYTVKLLACRLKVMSLMSDISQWLRVTDVRSS